MDDLGDLPAETVGLIVLWCGLSVGFCLGLLVSLLRRRREADKLLHDLEWSVKSMERRDSSWAATAVEGRAHGEDIKRLFALYRDRGDRTRNRLRSLENQRPG